MNDIAAANLARPATPFRVSTLPARSGIPYPLLSFRRRPAKKSLRGPAGRESLHSTSERSQGRRGKKQ
jgi:hypothetical protein